MRVSQNCDNLVAACTELQLSHKTGTAVSEKNICSLWYDHCKNLYNSVANNGDNNVIASACTIMNDNKVVCTSIREVKDAIFRLNTVKSAGPNGLLSEFLNSGVNLWIHLSLFYTFFIRRCYFPKRFMDTNIIFLVKNKCDDLTETNNYRTIVLSDVETKILKDSYLRKL